jgi:hypothetical protein
MNIMAILTTIWKCTWSSTTFWVVVVMTIINELQLYWWLEKDMVFVCILMFWALEYVGDCNYGCPQVTKQVGGGHKLPKLTRIQAIILVDDGIPNLTNWCHNPTKKLMSFWQW